MAYERIMQIEETTVLPVLRHCWFYFTSYQLLNFPYVFRLITIWMSGGVSYYVVVLHVNIIM